MSIRIWQAMIYFDGLGDNAIIFDGRLLSHAADHAGSYNFIGPFSGTDVCLSKYKLKFS
jgi:hypothetical protein